MKIELKNNKKNHWWRVVATNGNVIATSETYTTSSSRTRVAKKFSERTGIPIAVAVK